MTEDWGPKARHPPSFSRLTTYYQLPTTNYPIPHTRYTINHSLLTIHHSPFSRYKNFIKNIIIGGVPCSGKSILSRQLCSALNMAYFPLDSLVSAFGRVFPQLGIAHTSANDHIAVCNQLWPFVTEWITHLEYEDLSFLIDGYHIQPTNIREDIKLQEFKILFLGYPNTQPKQKTVEIRKYARLGDWTESLDEGTLWALVTRYIGERRRLQAECQRFGFDFIDVSQNFSETLDSTLASMLEQSHH